MFAIQDLREMELNVQVKCCLYLKVNLLSWSDEGLG